MSDIRSVLGGCSRFSRCCYLISDSFGYEQSDCRVREFVSLENEKNSNYASHFSGLQGRMVPYGPIYRVDVKCSDGRGGGTFLVAVERANAFLVLASWLNVGDYVTGPMPRLTISVNAKREPALTRGAWIKLVGLYLNQTEVDKLDGGSHVARFYDVVPGRYIMFLFAADGLVCTKQVDLVKAPTDLNLLVSGQSCDVEGESSERIQQH